MTHLGQLQTEYPDLEIQEHRQMKRHRWIIQASRDGKSVYSNYDEVCQSFEEAADELRGLIAEKLNS